MSEDPLIGKQLANFRVDRVLGRGGMAQVYYGWDVKLDRPVALKVIDARYRNEPSSAERFVREAKSIAAWRHENIVQVYYADEQDDIYFFAMEYIEGLSLAEWIAGYTDKGLLPPQEEVIRIGRAIANALDYAHTQGVIHRDIKPANVMLSEDGRVVLMDFGLALDMIEGSMGGVLGTPHYIAPEQARHSSDAVPQSDIYALGVVLYEMLTGEVPFDDPSSSTSIAIQHITQPPPPPRQINPELNTVTEDVLLKALSKEPESRHGSAGEMVAALESALASGSVEASEWSKSAPPSDRKLPPAPPIASRNAERESPPPSDPGGPPPEGPSSSGNRRWIAFAAAAAIVALAAILLLILSGRGGGDLPPTLTQVAALTFTRTAEVEQAVNARLTEMVYETETAGAPTVTPTFTPSDTLTDTATFTLTDTPTHTPTNTATFTPSDTLTFTPTDTPTPTATYTPSDTPDLIGTAAAAVALDKTATATHWTATHTPDNEATVQALRTEFAAQTSTAESWTDTPTPSDTFTPTHTATFTPTLTPSHTPTDTPSHTPTDTPTFTPSDTVTFTATDTLTLTATSTPTDTATFTPTHTPTATATPTLTPSYTPTPSDTPTATATPTPTPLPSVLLSSDLQASDPLAGWDVNGEAWPLVEDEEGTRYLVAEGTPLDYLPIGGADFGGWARYADEGVLVQMRFRLPRLYTQARVIIRGAEKTYGLRLIQLDVSEITLTLYELITDENFEYLNSGDPIRTVKVPARVEEWNHFMLWLQEDTITGFLNRQPELLWPRAGLGGSIEGVSLQGEGPDGFQFNDLAVLVPEPPSTHFILGEWSWGDSGIPENVVIEEEATSYNVIARILPGEIGFEAPENYALLCSYYPLTGFALRLRDGEDGAYLLDWEGGHLRVSRVSPDADPAELGFFEWVFAYDAGGTFGVEVVGDRLAVQVDGETLLDQVVPDAPQGDGVRFVLDDEDFAWLDACLIYQMEAEGG